MTRYAQHVNKRATPQREQASPKQRKNSAGGYAFTVDDWSRLDRWLILGAEGGTYYASEKKLSKENAKTIEACLHTDGAKTIARIVEISDSGRAPKNDPAIFALAIAAGHSDLNVRKAALAVLPQIARTGTHLFQFIESVKNFRGWGRGLREAVCKWYLTRKPDNLAYQVVKYQQRNGFSHRDVLRLAGGALSTLPVSPQQQAVFRWIVAGPQYDERKIDRKNGKDATYAAIDVSKIPVLINAYEQVKRASSLKEVVKLIEDHRLTHEMVPNEHKDKPEVWAALLPNMPITATIRNLGKMSAIGLLKPMSAASKLVVERLGDIETIRKGRVHPLAFLVALNTYRGGHGFKGKLSWTPVSPIVDALDEGFYLAFKAIEPTGKNRLVALDISGSMGCGLIAGMPGITPRLGSGAMAMTTVRTEANYHVVGFTNGSYRSMHSSIGYGSGITTIDLSKRMRLDDVIRKISGLPMGGTDCALPALWAAENKIEVDAIEILTDNETWAGNIHPHQALQQYRQKMGRDCKLIVVGMTSTGFSIGDPDDMGTLNVVGFDTAAPQIMANFIKEGYG